MHDGEWHVLVVGGPTSLLVVGDEVAVVVEGVQTCSAKTVDGFYLNGTLANWCGADHVWLFWNEYLRVVRVELVSTAVEHDKYEREIFHLFLEFRR